MNLVQRATNILTQPRPEWQRIDAEPASTGSLFGGYAAILALLPLIGTVIGGLLFASIMPMGASLGFTFIIASAVVGYLVSLGVLFLMGIIANALAPSFNGVKNDIGAMKLVVYSATATWVAGFFGFIPVVGFLVAIAGFAWAAYLLYLGSMAVMKVPPANAAGYTAVVVLIWIVVYFVVAAVLGMIMVAALFGGAAMGGGMMMR